MSDIRNILNIINENSHHVKPNLPESNPGETSDFVKNNARFAGHAEETLDSMVAGFDVETLPEFLEDEGVELPADAQAQADADEELNEYKWNPSRKPAREISTRSPEAKVFQCDVCNGVGTVPDEDDEVEICDDCLGTGYVDELGNAISISYPGFDGVNDDSLDVEDNEEYNDEKEYEEVFEYGDKIIEQGLGKDGKNPAVPYSKSTEKDLADRINASPTPRKDKRDHNDAGEGEYARHHRHMRQLSGLASVHDDDKDIDEAIDAQTRTIKNSELNDYLDRILAKKKGKTDKYKLPYVHRSNVKNLIPIVDPDGKRFDLDKLAADITVRPKTLLKQNEKMQHSDGTVSIFYNIGLPALTGLAYNEAKKEFVVINTCPGAGECKTYCYALKGGYVQWAPVSTSQTRILNFLYNDPSGFFDKLNREIDEQKRKGDAKQEKHKVVVRWHDAGDFFSDEYLNLAYDLAQTHPTVDFYAYTKMADVSGSTQNRPPNFMINFSMGARKAEEKRVDFGLTKHSSVVPKDLFSDLLKKDGNKLVKGPDGEWQWNSPEDYETFKERMAAKYSIDPKSVITYDEMMKTPMGGGGIGSGVADGDRSFKRGIYNVIVKPGDGDDSANRADVLGTYLLMH